MSGLIWIQTVWHSDGIPEIIYWKSEFQKVSVDDKKHAKITQHAKSFYFMMTTHEQGIF